MCVFNEDELSVEAIVARNMGDDDWEELISYHDTGCSRRATVEVEHYRPEAEPNIDKFTPDQLHAARRV